MASSFSIESVWRALHDAHEPQAHAPSTLGVSSMPGQAWSRTPGPSGLDGLRSFGRSSVARVMRLRHALEDSVPLAFEELQRLLGAISFAEVRQVLAALVRDIALVWCGSVILGSGGGAVLGELGFGVGAVPGAALGAEVGAAAGEALLAMFGLKALAESMVASMPRALRAYRQGARDAWDDPPFHDPHDEHDTFRLRQAAWELAQGHLALLQALLTAMLAMLSRGGTARALALHEIGAKSHLGPAVARWLEEREAALREALERAGRRDTVERARVPSRADASVVTPAQLRAEAEARKLPATRPPGATIRPARVGDVEGGTASTLWSDTPGVLTGRRTTIPGAADAATTRSLMRENESADILVQNGFNVEQNPTVLGTKNPDYRINGEVFDNYAPSTGNAQNIWRNVQDKVEAGQAPNVVINLADSPATVNGLVDQFKNYQIPDLQRVIFIDQDGNVFVHLHYKTGG